MKSYPNFWESWPHSWRPPITHKTVSQYKDNRFSDKTFWPFRCQLSVPKSVDVFLLNPIFGKIYIDFLRYRWNLLKSLVSLHFAWINPLQYCWVVVRPYSGLYPPGLRCHRFPLLS